MTDKQFLLAVLADGRPRSQAEILRRSFTERGCGMTIHSRAADLRRDGHQIVCWHDNKKGLRRGEGWFYRLDPAVAAGPLPPPATVPLTGTGATSPQEAALAPVPVSGQLSLEDVAA